MMPRTDVSGPGDAGAPRGLARRYQLHASDNVPDPAMTAVVEEATRFEGIRRRGDRYTWRWRDRSGRQHRGSARTLEEAKARRAQDLAAVWTGGTIMAGRQPFAEYARTWIDTFQGRSDRGIREETRRDYRSVLDRDAIPFFGRMPLGGVTPMDVKEYTRRVASRGVSPGTVRLALAPVRALFATALEDGLVQRNPCAGVRVAQPAVPDDAPVKALADDQLADLVAAVPEQWRDLVDLLSETGLRIGEALALEWSDVDLGQRRLQVQRRLYRGQIGAPKSRYGRRTIPLTARMAQTLWRRQAAAHGRLVFPSRVGGYLELTNLYRWFDKAATAAGVPWAGFHTLRHTCATRLFRGGWNARQVQLMLGHHSPAFTLATYVHTMADELPEPSFAVRTAEAAEEPPVERLPSEPDLAPARPA